MVSAEFLITSLVVVLIPGTGVIYTVSNGLFLGWRASIAAAVGCTAGILPHLIACIMGISAILHLSAVVFQVIKYLGVAYLMYLAWAMWRDTGSLRFDSHESRANLWQIIVRGLLINILNPKLSIFFLAFLPLFISSEAGSPTLQLVWLSVLFMAMTLVVFILYGIAANGVRQYVLGSDKSVQRLQRLFASVFAALGIKLALTEQ